MKFGLFVYCTVGRRAELEQGMAGRNRELYQRMLKELGDLVGFVDDRGYFAFGHPEHHLQIEGFELSNDPALMAMWLAQHSKNIRIVTCGFVSTVNNPLMTAEKISTMDNMLQGRFGVGLVRGYQARWVENYKVKPELTAVGPWNAKSEADDLNREYFAEFVDIVVTALQSETINYQGKFWQFPPKDFVNPHDHPVYYTYGKGVDEAMRIQAVGIAPRPFQDNIPLYGGFSQSLRTAKFWAKYKGRPIVLSGNTEFLSLLWQEWEEEAKLHGHDVKPGDQACWGGIMICAETDEKAWKLYEDMEWFWKTWATPFGQGVPELLIGSPDTLNKRIELMSNTVPIDEAFLLIPQGILAPEQLHESLDLFSRKVMPNFAD
ncbi:MAG: LLM class flavin-dependent oxidoreductase [bacterium]|nr:LLM class flavin-dependent oxidoreductase [Gammaproteobacteria bacterium]HIL83783.1 LLM class flavin-dependent oxidoreductase [Pseudomonadales bacterium]